MSSFALKLTQPSVYIPYFIVIIIVVALLIYEHHKYFIKGQSTANLQFGEKLQNALLVILVILLMLGGGLMAWYSDQNFAIPDKHIRMILIVLGLFIVSSIFQTIAWYHNADGTSVFWKAWLMSMMFVAIEYLFLLPGNTIGAKVLSIFQLGVIAEACSWIVFIIYLRFWRNEHLSWKHVLCLVLIFSGVMMAMKA